MVARVGDTQILGLGWAALCFGRSPCDASVICPGTSDGLLEGLVALLRQ